VDNREVQEVQGTRDTPERLELQVLLVPAEGLAPLALPVCPVPRDRLVLPVSPVLLEVLAHLAPWDPLVALVMQVCLVPLEWLAHLEVMEPQESLDHPVGQAHLDQ